MKTLTYTLQDFILANNLSITNDSSVKKFMLFIFKYCYMPFGILSICFGVYIYIYDLQKFNSSTPDAYLISFFIYMGVLCFFFGFIINSGLRRLKRLTIKEWETNKSLHLPINITWNEDKLFITYSESLKTERIWSLIYKLVLNDNYIYLYTGAISFLIIPKRCFENEIEMNDFISYAKKGVEQNKIK